MVVTKCLNTMQVGDYVAYVGNNGCLNGGEGVTGSGEVVAGNSCKGENANQSIDISGETYGYCEGTSSSYSVYGWRIAYIDDDKVHLISAGAPECNSKAFGVTPQNFIIGLNTGSLKYCNKTYADGGSCSSSNTWTIGNADLKKITYEISGTSSNLSSDFGNPYCASKQTISCGYGNDLLDNGGDYYFASYIYSSDYDEEVMFAWFNSAHGVFDSASGTYGLRPIIRLSSSVYVTGGSGTMTDPWQIGI